MTNAGRIIKMGQTKSVTIIIINLVTILTILIS